MTRASSDNGQGAASVSAGAVPTLSNLLLRASENMFYFGNKNVGSPGPFRLETQMPRKHRPKTVKQEGDLRRNEHGEPVLVVVSQLQMLCHSVQIGDEESKLSVSQGFIDHLNSEVVDLVEYCMQKAVDAGRSTLLAEDVPTLDNYLPDEYLPDVG